MSVLQQFDFRRVEKRWKGLAFVVLAILLTCILVIVVWLHPKHVVIDYSMGEDFGNFPSLALCNRPEHPVEFVTYHFEFRHVMYKSPGGSPQISVYQTWEELEKGVPETKRSCLNFVSYENNLDTDIEFRVTLKEEFNSSAPQQFSEPFSDMILNAHRPPSKEKNMKDNAILSSRTYAGNLAILPTYDSHAETAVMTVLRVARSEHRDTKRWGMVPVWWGKWYVSYVTRSLRTYHLHRSSFGSALPREEEVQVPVCEACPKLSEKNSLKVVHWDIYIPRPRLVEISQEKTEFEVFLNSVMKAGGDFLPKMKANFFGAIFEVFRLVIPGGEWNNETHNFATTKGMNLIFAFQKKCEF